MNQVPEPEAGPIAWGKGIARRLGRRMPWYTPSGTVESRNIRNLYADTLWFGMLSGVAETYVSVFALRLGATTGQVGWLTALPALVTAVWLIPAARIIELQQRRIPIVLLAGFLQRVGYLSMAIMPFLVITGRVQALIIINTLITLPTAVINTAITSLIPDLAGAEHRARVISVRWMILSAVATLSALIGGKFLDLVPLPLNYQLLLGTSTLLSLLSLLYLKRIAVPNAVLLRRADHPRQRYSWNRLRQIAGKVTGHQEFVRFTIAAFVFYAGLYLPAALWSVFRVRDLGASDAWIGIIALVVNGSTIAGYLYWEKLSHKRGDRWLLVVSAIGVTAYTAVTALVPTIGWMIPSSVLGGLSWAGCNLALFSVLLRVCPDEHRPTYVALYTALLNVTAFAAPLLGAVLADWIGIRLAFGLSSVVRLGGVLLFLRLVR